jgi:thiamine pyrophosphokinase
MKSQHPKIIAALFLNGEKPTFQPITNDYQLIVCTDGAYHYLLANHIVPDLITGDFDSIDELPGHIDHIHTPDQNFTDFEKALKIIIDKGYKHVDVFAANGLEQDHFLGNMTVALKYINKIKIKFYDDRQIYYFANNHTVIEQVQGKTISLFPFPDTYQVSSHGLKYPLENDTLSMIGNKIGTRNYALQNTVTITFSEGYLLLFIER